MPTVYDLSVGLPTVETEVEDATKAETELKPLIANTRFEWRNRKPWAVVIRRRGKDRNTVYTISKYGEYASEWECWQAVRERWEAGNADNGDK